MVVPHEPGMLALAFVLVGHDAKPKVRKLCRERLNAALDRLENSEKSGPFAGSPMAVRSAGDMIRTVCRACGTCAGV